MSDYGDTDHYVAVVKASILKSVPGANIIDISHKIQKFNLPHAAHVLKSSFKEFPEETIHIVAVNTPIGPKDKFIAIKLEGHFFIGMDNGLLSLISESEPDEIVELNASEKAFIFPAKYVLVPAATELFKGRALSELGAPMPSIRKMLNRQVRLTKNQIIGQVIHIDHYGNLVTNISKKEFENLGKGRRFALNFSRESIDEISSCYTGKDSGDCVAVFNSNDVLEIAICHGNAAELLGMKYESPVIINFSEV